MASHQLWQPVILKFLFSVFPLLVLFILFSIQDSAHNILPGFLGFGFYWKLVGMETLRHTQSNQK